MTVSFRFRFFYHAGLSPPFSQLPRWAMGQGKSSVPQTGMDLTNANPLQLESIITMRYDRCAHTLMSAIVIAAMVIFWINHES